MTNRHHSVLHTGVSSDLRRRADQHREKLLPGFTARYNVTKLVYYECTEECDGRHRSRKADQGSLTPKEDCAHKHL
jgi:putative endonuclease